MSKTRNLSDLLDANGDVKSTALDNVPASDVVNDTTPQLGGNLDSNGNTITLPDSTGATVNRLRFGNSADLTIYHDGSNSYIDDNGTGDFIIRGRDIAIKSITDENHIVCVENGATSLYHDNSKKFETTSGGVKISGALHLDDNNRIELGNDNDLILRHNGTNSEINDQGTGDLLIGTTGNKIRLHNQASTQIFAEFNNNGAVELRHNGSTKFATSSTGATVTGTLSATTFSGGGLGKVLQVVQSDTGTTTNITSGSAVDTTITGTITPSSTSSKILVQATIQYINRTGTANNLVTYLQCLRGTTQIGGRLVGRVDGYVGEVGGTMVFTDIDSPSTTSATTYKIQAFLNSTGDGRTLICQPYIGGVTSISKMTLIELAS